MLRSARLKAHLSTTTFLLESSGDIGWAVFCKLPNYLGVPSAQPLSSYRSFSSMSISLFRIDSMKILWKSHQSSMHIYDIIYTNKIYIYIYIYDIICIKSPMIFQFSEKHPVTWGKKKIPDHLVTCYPQKNHVDLDPGKQTQLPSFHHLSSGMVRGQSDFSRIRWWGAENVGGKLFNTWGVRVGGKFKFMSFEKLFGIVLCYQNDFRNGSRKKIIARTRNWK